MECARLNANNHIVYIHIEREREREREREEKKRLKHFTLLINRKKGNNSQRFPLLVIISLVIGIPPFSNVYTYIYIHS